MEGAEIAREVDERVGVGGQLQPRHAADDDPVVSRGALGLELALDDGQRAPPAAR
jgi:hypothetical protein